MNGVEAILNAEMFISAHWTVWAEYGGYSVGVVALLQFIKRKYGIDKAKGFSFLGLWRMDGPRIMAALFGLWSAAAAGLTWIINPANAAYVPVRFSFLIATGAAIHRFLISPASLKIEAKIKPYIQALQQLQTMEQGLVAKEAQRPAVGSSEPVSVATAPGSVIAGS